MRKQASIAELQRQCDEWNAVNPIRTHVTFQPTMGVPNVTDHTTTSEAYLLSGHTAVIHISGKAGCVALDRCRRII